MKRMKRLATLGLATMLVGSSVVTVGCGGSKGEKGSLSIRYYVGGYGETWLKQAVKAYQKINPDVKFTLKSDEEIGSKVTQYLSVKNPNADIYLVDEFAWQDAARKKLIEPLDDVMESKVKIAGTETTIKDALIDGFEFYPYASVGGTESAYVMPWAADNVSVIYNEDLMKKTPKTGGGTWTTFPATESEFKQFIADINAASGTAAYGNKEVKPFVYAGSSLNVLSWPHMIWWAQYQGIDADNCLEEGSYSDFWQYESKDVFKQTGLTESYGLVQEIFVNYEETDPSKRTWVNVPSNNGALSAQEAELEFVKGTAVMTLNGAWMENEIAEVLDLPNAYPDLQDYMRMAYLPAIDGAKETNVNLVDTGSVMVVSSKSENKDVAKDFLKFLNTEEQMANFTKYTGTMRPFKYDPSDAIGDMVPFRQDIIDMFLNGNNIFEGSAHSMYRIAGVTPYVPNFATIFGDLRKTTAQKTTENAFTWANDSWETWKTTAGLNS